MSSPLEGAAPPGGFGTPAPGSAPGIPGAGPNTPPPGGAPPGGFGPPAGGPPPGGGFGAPGGAPPPGGGFGAPPPQAQPQQGFGAPPAQAMAPPKKKSKTGLLIGVGCLLFLVLGCLGGGGYLYWKANQAVDEFENDLNEAVDAANDAADTAAGGGAAAGGGSCSRIAACCRAYVGAMGASVPASTCDAYNNVAGMQDSMCDQTMAGYRTGLQAMGRDVPSECN